MTAAIQISKRSLGAGLRGRSPFHLSPQQRAWLVWAVSALFVLFQFFIQLTSGEMVAGLMRSFQLDAFTGGVLASSYYYIYTVLQAPAGLLVDRFGARRLLTAGAVVLSFGCWLFASSVAVGWALLGRLLMGCGASFAFVGCLNVISNWFPVRRFGIMVSIAEVMGMLGSALGGLGLAAVILHCGWRWSMLAAAALSAVMALLLWVTVRDRPDCKRVVPRAALREFVPDLSSLLRSRVVWCNALYSGLIFTIMTVFVALWAIPFVQKAHGVTLFTASAVCDMTFMGAAVGCPLLGYWDSRFACRRQLLVLFPVLAAVLMAVIVFGDVRSIGLLACLFGLLGVSVSSYMLTFVIGHQVATAKTKGVSNGFVNMFSVGTAPLLQPLVGYVADVFSGCGSSCHGVQGLTVWGYQCSFSILIIGLMLAAVLGCFLPKKPMSTSS